MNMRSCWRCTNVSTAVHILGVSFYDEHNLFSAIIGNNYTFAMTVITNPDQSVDDNSLQMFIFLKISGSQLCTLTRPKIITKLSTINPE